MIIVFQLGGEMVIVKAQGNNILFSNSLTNFSQFVPIDTIRLTREGILKQFPELKYLPDSELRTEAISRFKGHVKTLDSEEKIKDYLITEFTGMGYTVKSIQREGFRTTKK